MLQGGIDNLMREDLTNFGSKVSSLLYLDMVADAENRKPILQSYDAYGNRVDKIHTTEGWRFFKREAAIEQLISLPYKSNAQNSRMH